MVNIRDDNKGLSGSLKELSAMIAALNDETRGVRELIRTRLDGVDRVAAALAENISRVPMLLEKDLTRLDELFREKFSHVAIEFENLNRRTDRDKDAAAIAVATALQAQKEGTKLQNTSNSFALEKTNEQITRQIETIMALVTTFNATVDERIRSINNRLDRTVIPAVIPAPGPHSFLILLFMLIAGIVVASTTYLITVRPI